MSSNERVLVVGAGPVGMVVALALKLLIFQLHSKMHS